jgi:AbiJ N-terminal domain 4
VAVFETYASRLRRTESAGQPDVYVYDDLPPFLRKQLSQIFTCCIGPGYNPGLYDMSAPPNANKYWTAIAELLDREIPTFGRFATATAHEWCMAYLKSSDDLPGVLSLIEVCCRMMEQTTKEPGHALSSRGVRQRPADGLEEVNIRFKNARVGYQFEAGDIVRVDSQFVHAEVVKPALELLAAPEFAEANREFRLAHEHYRAGKLRDCNTAALRSMETVLKVICNARGWHHEAGATVERLIAVVRQNGLFPDYLGGYFDNLIGAMKAGLPKIRDKDGGHGVAPGQPGVPEHVAGFALHLAASNVVLLAQAHLSKPMPREAARLTGSNR